MSEHLLSVATPVYNTHGPWLRDCLDSILSQGVDDMEVVVVDDGSTKKDTLEVLERYAALGICVLRHEKNRGVGYAMHRALRACTGKYVGLVGSDDVMLPGRLPYQLRLLEVGGFHLVSGQVQFANAAGEVKGESRLQDRRAMDWLKRVFDPTVTLDRKDALAIGGFNRNKRQAEAADLWRRWKRAYGTGRVFVSRELATMYRLHAGSLSYKRRGGKHLQRWRTG